MTRPPSLLTLIEVLAIGVWVTLAAVLIFEEPETELTRIDVEALTSGPSQERWFGVFFQDQHTGFMVTRSGSTPDGGGLYESRSHFRFSTFGQLHEIVQASTALTDDQGRLRRFDFFTVSGDVRLSARGEVHAGEIVMEVEQLGEVSRLSFPVDRPPQVGSSLEDVIRRTELSVGKTITVPFFDPLTMADGDMIIKVTGVEVFENGEEAYWLESSFSGFDARMLVTPSGATLREESPALGVSKVRMTAEEAQDVPTSAEPVDLIAMSAVQLRGKLENARSSKRLALRIRGVDPERVRHEPPLQSVSGDVVTITSPDVTALPALPVATDAPETLDATYLEATLTIPSAHPEIRARSARVLADITDRRTAAETLTQYVYDYVEKVPTAGVPNGLEVLRSARGDCNEHTALYVSLARAARIPTRIAAGVVYSDRISTTGAFYYHAWPEVQLGGSHEWVPVDPTFGQFPADATHVKLVEGDLDRQIEIMAVMGRLGFEMAELPPLPALPDPAVSAEDPPADPTEVPTEDPTEVPTGDPTEEQP